MNETDKANCMLRAKSMECISLVGMAVGKDKFKDDAKQVMDVLMLLQGSQLETNDPTISYMLQAWARLCKCLGQDFLPYMNVVMPPLLHFIQLKPDVTITYADDSDDDIDGLMMKDKIIRTKTSVLDEKATTCNMICCYTDELKEGFFPWIDQVAPTLVPLLKFYFHKEVRKAIVSDDIEDFHFVLLKMMHTIEVEEALMLKTMAEEVEALIEGSNVKANDQSQKSPEGVPPTYEDVVAPLFTLPII
ncbi:unnamed protein product [Lactuca saligna]|uniref:Uncharacterized protein n=1 Tax=Lactuca saligna TaxID=75948 RepID=A0AA35Z568_LACSI|nr:unnamed protein product [Lactuca saligna]